MKQMHFIYQPGQTNCQSIVTTHEDGTQTADHTSEISYDRGNPTVTSPDVPAVEYLAKLNRNKPAGSPDFVMLTWEELKPLIYAAQDAKYLTEWEEITAAQYDEMLNVLPPEKWQTCNGVSLFRMSEYYTGNITGHYAACLGRYWTRRCRTSPTYDAMASEIQTLRAA